MSQRSQRQPQCGANSLRLSIISGHGPNFICVQPALNSVEKVRFPTESAGSNLLIDTVEAGQVSEMPVETALKKRAPSRTSATKGAASDIPLSYGDFLALDADDRKRKGERTRDKLKAAAARLLESQGYRDLRVTDINEAAGVSNALFYVYFENKEVIAKEVLSGFLGFLDTFRERDAGHETVDQAIYYGNLRYAQIFKANAGLMRCLFQFSDEFPDFGNQWRAWNAAWWQRASRSLGRNAEIAFATAAETRLALAALGSMVDGLLRMAMIERDEKVSNDPAQLAIMLTQLWVRSLFRRELRWTP